MRKILNIVSVTLASLLVASGLFYFCIIRPALAGVTCSLPFTLTNGTTADASQVMANYNALVTCLTNAAAAGANNDITSLTGLTTPITPAEGGSQVYAGGTPTVSGNILIFNSTTPSGWANTTNQSLNFVSPITNTTVLQFVVNNQVTKNVFKLTAAGPIALVGGEIVTNQAYNAIFDGSQFEINPFPNVTAGWGIAVAPTAVSISTKNPPYGFDSCINMTLSATVGSNLLGLQLFAADTGLAPTSTHPILCPFSDPTQPNGDPKWVSIESAKYMDTNAAGASLGTLSGLPFRIWVVLYYNGGTPNLGLWQSTSFTPGAQAPQGNNIQLFSLDESQLQSPTAISAAATSAGTFYAPNGSAISNSPFRILGYFDFGNGLTTPGTYATGPTKIQLYGPGIRKPGDRINFVKSTLATATAASANTYAPSATKPVPTNGVTVTSVTISPVASMDIFNITSLVNVGANGQLNSAFIYDGTVAVANVQQVGAAGDISSLSPAFTGIVTSASRTFTLYGAGNQANVCINAAPNACLTIGAISSWLAVEELQP